MVKRWIAAFIVLAACRPAWAIDNEGNYLTRGVGIELCSSYNSARATHRDAEFTAWLAGYLSGFDRWTSDVFDIEGNSGFDGAMHWLDYYCQVNPRTPFSIATENLVAFLYPARTRSSSTAALPPPVPGAGSSRAPQ
jgi:hypothetical protein